VATAVRTGGKPNPSTLTAFDDSKLVLDYLAGSSGTNLEQSSSGSLKSEENCHTSINIVNILNVKIFL
jgi:hypothetical protein